MDSEDIVIKFHQKRGRIRDLGSGKNSSRIRIPDPGVKKALDPGSATLIFSHLAEFFPNLQTTGQFHRGGIIQGVLLYPLTPWKTPRKSTGEWDYRTRIISLLSSMKPGQPVLQGCQLKLKKNPLKTPDFSQKIP
jgi:hypothetical protein